MWNGLPLVATPFGSLASGCEIQERSELGYPIGIRGSQVGEDSLALVHVSWRSPVPSG